MTEPEQPSVLLRAEEDPDAPGTWRGVVVTDGEPGEVVVNDQPSPFHVEVQAHEVRPDLPVEHRLKGYL